MSGPTGVPGAVGPGRCVCRRAAAHLRCCLWPHGCSRRHGCSGLHGCSGHRRARPLCVPEGGGPPASRPRREPTARRVVSKHSQALPPPSGTVAGPSGALHTCGAWCAHGFSASARSPAWPRCLNPRRPVVLRWRQALINRVRSFHSAINLVHLQHCTT